jgi:alpha,alpha-trehalase
VSPSVPIPPYDAPLTGGSPFVPIADYAFLSDCHTAALVAPDGGVEWLCVPRFDSPSVFGSLLDRRAGTFRIGPYGTVVPLAVRYVPGTMVLETTWMTPSGWILVRDALTMGAWDGRHADELTHGRSPTDHDADHMLIRTVECTQGEVELEVLCQPMFD